MIGALASAGISAAVDGLSNWIGQSATLNKNKELADYQFEQNKKMWELQNEYNKPINQMSRYQEAGLNKNLIYGQGSNGNAQNAPTYNAPTADFTIPKVNSLQKWINTKQLEQQVEMNDKIQQNYDATMLKTAAETSLILDNLNNMNPARRSLWSKQKDSWDAGIKKTVQETESNKWHLQKSKDLWSYDMQYAGLRNQSLQAEIQNKLSDLLTKSQARDQIQMNMQDQKEYGRFGGLFGSGASLESIMKNLKSIPWLSKIFLNE